MTIGDKLREARQKKGLTLKEVEYELRIRSVYLEAMEKNDFDAIPGQAYVKGFLRSYAAFLGLDPDEIIREYNTLHGYAEESGEMQRIQTLPVFLQRILFAIFALATIALAVYLALPERKSEPLLPPAPVNETTSLPSKNQEVTSQPAIEPGETTQTTETTEKKPLTVRIEVIEEKSWIQISDGEKNLAAGTFSAGESLDTTVPPGARIIIGYPKAVRIFINGKELVDFQKTGVLRATITERGLE